MSRAERLAELEMLLDDGLTVREARLEMGISNTYAYDLLNDPTGADARRRKDGYRGSCGRCGARTDGSGGRKAPEFCAHCAPTENRRWTRPAIIATLRAFYYRFGRSPASTDLFGPGRAALSHYGPVRRAELIMAREWAESAGGLPTPSVVKKEFGSHEAALEAAGLPKCPAGGAAHRPRVAA